MIHGCQIIQYANDTQFEHTGTVDNLPDLISRAETTPSLAKKYFNRNGVMLNSSKSQCLFIGTRQLIKEVPNNTIINFVNASITPSKHVKNLCICMDRHMTFDVHMHETQRAMGILLDLSKIKDKFKPETRKTVIESFSLSTFNYCLPVYGITSTILLQQMQRLQNISARICPGVAKRFDNSAGSKL